MHATKWYSLIEQEKPGICEGTWVNLVNRDCSEEADRIVAEFFALLARSRGDPVDITAVTWKEQRQKLGLVSRSRRVKAEPLPLELPPVAPVADETQATLSKAIAAVEANTRAIWALESRLKQAIETREARTHPNGITVP